MATIDRYLGKVFCVHALDLLRTMPVESVDAVIADAMYGVAKNCRYDWGPDPARGDPVKHWRYHEPIYRECLRVLKPAGVLAWGQGFKFVRRLDDWFGPHRVSSPLCVAHGLNVIPNIWAVQTREQRPIEHPNDMIVLVNRNILVPLKKSHPCPKPVEELEFMIRSLTRPGQIVLDCFCGLGSTLLAAKRLSRLWIGCDRSRAYCRSAMRRLRRTSWAQPGAA